MSANLQTSITPLLTHLQQAAALSADEIQFLENEVTILHARKNDQLLEAGAVSSAFYFILEGCVRLYYTAEAEEKTAFFYTEGMFVSSYESFTKQVPAKHNLQCVEDCSLAVFTTESAMRLLQYSPRFELLARIAMEEELSIYQEIISSFVTLNAEQRYIRLLETNPALLQRIPQHQIATYLGVTAETLSRIRKRITGR